MSKRTAHLSRQTIEAIESALFSKIAEANTELRNVPSREWGSGELWATKRAQSLSALREILTYAETHYSKRPGRPNQFATLRRLSFMKEATHE